MEIKTGKANSEPESPAVEVPPDRGNRGRKKIAQKHQRGKPLTARLLVVAKVIVLVMLSTAGIIATYVVVRFAYSADLLTLRTVQVEGCLHADAAKIEKVIRSEFSSNILRIDLQRLRARLEREPWVRRVEIRRVLPARLVVKIEERAPSVIADIGGNLELLDDEGFLLDHYDAASGKLDVPVFTGLRGDDAAAYKVYQEDNSSRVRTGVQVLGEISAGSPDLARALSEIDLSDPANIRVLLVDDTAVVHLGDHDFFKRLQIFMSNMNQYHELKAQGKDISAVDLRFESKIVYRLRQPSTEQADAKSRVSRNP